MDSLTTINLRPACLPDLNHSIYRDIDNFVYKFNFIQISHLS